MHDSLPRRSFGTTGLEVSALGLGAGQLGDTQLSDREAERLLDEALALGINLVDTARSYGPSEERIGRFLRARHRDAIVLSTKLGYGIPGVADWTPECIARGVDAARARLGVDTVDIVHLHSCPREVLESGGVVDALADAVRAGKVRVAAYSGDNEAAEYAVASGHFGSVQTSLSVCDQRAGGALLDAARERGMGVIAKRPVANAPWRFATCPSGNEAEFYWHRWQAMKIDTQGLAWQEIAVRFAVWCPGVHSAIVGTANPGHLRENLELAARGPLPDDLYRALRDAFAQHAGEWAGRI
ncbi:aldo/keto reductase [Haliangium ochraceum]|uniref:Aldo/keto reductase n=1 Tax=Haliangium ochraceum (strain DSM 14365 / JCM 11303 / SMP-2) TaxID=502025 RepID=D0LU37_HALO1|nr:aldo/keto reductase [Haliangium ochraceum]ACY17401.1 aldo/keto reductase [Haliangium ochraceum DSM 14365]